MKFKFKQKVKVLSGFYEGQTGVVRHGEPKRTELFWEYPERYIVRLDEAGAEYFNEDQLEALVD